MSDVSYDVRVQKVEKRRNKKGAVTSHRICWTVQRRLHRQSFRAAAQADAFRSELIMAVRKGEAFSLHTGRPISWMSQPTTLSWYAFSVAYCKAKWPYASPNHRRGIAEALTDVTEAALLREPGPDRENLRAALRWSYSTGIRDGGEPPPSLVKAVAWLETNTVKLDAFEERSFAAGLARQMLARVSQTKGGLPAAANTANRKRMVLNNAMEYACEIGALTENPLRLVRWTRPRTLTTVDPRVVINREQARRFLAAVATLGGRGKRLKAFFALMYYAGLRPEEATELRRMNITRLPEEPDEWGEMQLTYAQPRSGSRWTDSGKVREQSPLKHRAKGDTRRVPVHPELVVLLRDHLEQYVAEAPESRVFSSLAGGPVTDRMYLKVFHEARAAAFTEAEAATQLMDVPYSLRHAAVSTWLRSTGDPVQVAEWAGHSAIVLLRVYAKCVHGAEAETLKRIWDSTRT